MRQFIFQPIIIFDPGLISHLRFRSFATSEINIIYTIILIDRINSFRLI